ncbi:MAG: excinuclease ABC subunit B [Deltaproteobacteria bacterium CG23_combo_of_CG06-09_8_20_14_all_51_20]|nr:excinuclease ABC subunit UvrB [bacterium]NCP10000.1 excinuclease ABC subunit UvrB [bacterium]OIP40335.1 MAG: excinuclease ABC subunit B [Desulfobacteraceae bacterium CG2_30_51_40]PIP47810.1 MAG: excinuclease ABC subunit B [Deltaproteobacteria bacterium CG23_combo_of_CG06-09_8_20_14_all_51_20]PJB38607.1 MAG: excinuclease ABC subunit B [Deltaproteobacteria bacterium CG_4_9_14_3_um_filter_51_14]
MFRIRSDFAPCGDQPQAIDALSEGIARGLSQQILLGVTGSGKTFTMAHVIERTQRPTLVIAPNKTLAAQLYGEFKRLFPDNAVEYFVSYYDYYQPEAYIPQSDTYIQKDSSINDQIDKMRHAATRSLLDRDDAIIVASVSCIYGLGSPEAYHGMILYVEKGTTLSREDAIAKLVEIHYERGDMDFFRGRFRARGDILDIYPAHEEDRGVRICFFGDLVEAIREIDPLTGKTLRELNRVTIYPATHYVTTVEIRERAIGEIKEELKEQVEHFRGIGKLLEAQRVEERTLFDLEMMIEMGYCHGIENYSRHLTGRHQGEPPPTLLDYFPGNFLLIIDESHITIPQLHGMYRGDRSRKDTLVQYGFRLPSALDNRPLTFEEFQERVGQSIYVSATPGPYELSVAQAVVEQIIRPTGLADPEIEVKDAKNQVDDLLGEIRKTVTKGERVLVTTLTKKMAEDLCEYYADLGVKIQYLHSDIKTIERVDILRDLRLGVFDVLVGINLLREGLDLPEVSLVAILDADKEGFLRSERSLIQTAGRAARNINGKVILYADQITDSMRRAMEESSRRRGLQLDYNEINNITPVSITRAIEDIMASPYEADYVTIPKVAEPESAYMTTEQKEAIIKTLTEKMKKAARNLEFEDAAALRDRIRAIEKEMITASLD